MTASHWAPLGPSHGWGRADSWWLLCQRSYTLHPAAPGPLLPRLSPCVHERSDLGAVPARRVSLLLRGGLRRELSGQLQV